MSNQFFQEEPEVKSQTQAVVQEPDKKMKTVSFSQYAMWLKCPMQWKLSYIDKLAPYEASIHTVFGTGIHEALQEYLRLLYTVGTAEADALDTFALFKKSYEEGLKELKIATEEQMKLSEDEIDELGLVTPQTIAEFENDGKVILDHVLAYAQRSKHFPSKKYEIVGIELPLEIPLRGGTILYKGFLDIVLRDKDTKKILILDFKTSTNGWNKYQKADRTKIDQLLLYKRFYNQLFKIPMSEIEIEFMVLKRKLLENVEFPQQRIQRISPPDGKMSMKEVETSFLDFINEGFTKEGEYNTAHKFIKNPGKARKNCKYCIFKDLKSPEGKLYCDGKEG
jgi:ATP-dependent exoDNAse (exonuclease V) beta subunit